MVEDTGQNLRPAPDSATTATKEASVPAVLHNRALIMTSPRWKPGSSPLLGGDSPVIGPARAVVEPIRLDVASVTAQGDRATRRRTSVLLVAAMLLAIAALALTGGRVAYLADIRVRWAPLMLAALALAVTITTLFPQGNAVAHRVINLATYAVAIAVLWRNRTLPGLPAALVGTALNVTAITANNGVMPAWRPALDIAGLPAASHDFLSSTALTHPRLLILGDILAVPSWVPFANVFSIGDVLIVAGISFTILCLGDSRLIPSRTRARSRARHHDAETHQSQRQQALAD
jgi:hypothetical protein